MKPLMVRELSIGYPTRTIASAINFEVEEGEFVAICGENGAGKTTLLKTIARVIESLSGSITYGFNLNESPLGYVPQRDNLDPFFPVTVLDVVVMGRTPCLGMVSNFRKVDYEIARECLSVVGLVNHSDADFFTLSGGQRQRALIARALCVNPKLLLLDEPTTGTDPRAEAAIINLLVKLNEEKGLAILVVSHHIGVVRALISSTIFLAEGKAEKGPTDELLSPARMQEVFGLAIE